MAGIDRRLIVDVVTMHGIPLAQAAGIVRYILEQVVEDLRRCERSLTDEEWKLGVRIAATRIEYAEGRVGGTNAKAPKAQKPRGKKA